MDLSNYSCLLYACHDNVYLFINRSGFTYKLSNVFSLFIWRRANVSTTTIHSSIMASTSQLHFDPDLHPDDTLKQFNQFYKRFDLRYNAQYPDPPKVSMEAAIERWKYTNEDQKPNLTQYDEIRSTWISKDKVAKFLGIFSSERLHEDWMSAEPDENERKNVTWEKFISSLQKFYLPTENTTLKHYQFRSITQNIQETFISYCNRVEKEAKNCNYKCTHDDCTAENVAIRDQIIIGTSNDKIREEALKKSWDLATLRKEGMHMESAYKGAEALSADTINKIGKYSQKYKNRQKQENKFKAKVCYFCGSEVTSAIRDHVRQCQAKKALCNGCGKTGHYEKVCRSKNVKQIDTETSDEEENQSAYKEDETYSINIFHINTHAKWNHTSSTPTDFQVQVIINNNLEKVLADTGAKVSVCGEQEARRYGLLKQMFHTTHKLKPYKSSPIPVKGISRCAVTFGQSSIPVEWNIIEGSCQPILSGNAAKQLGIISFQSQAPIFSPINMIHDDHNDSIQDIISKFPENFKGLGKLKDYQVKLHVDENVKPITSPPLPIPYHLQERANIIINEMITQGVIEEHPTDQSAPWISNCVIAPKPDGSLRMTLDARNINKAIQSSNLPIPKQEDIKASLANSKIFSKMDFKTAFWQLELHPSARHLTVFRANNKLYRYKRLTMGLKPAQGELNTALGPLFAGIANAHLIHDDLIIAAKDIESHNLALKQVMEAIDRAEITLNPDKCMFGYKEIKFWGLIISEHGIKPDPEKVNALDHITCPKSKEELISFLCMMQSNAEFIPNFSKKSAVLRELTKGDKKFVWEKEQEHCFSNMINEFKTASLLQYFDMNKRTFIFTDAHKSGLGAMLAQGSSIEDAHPVAVASRTTNKAEQRYPQIDLEAMGIDFALRRFRNYLVGSPDQIEIITDHKPLRNIFNGNRKGSVRTERVKLRHQDIRFHVTYQKGKINQADYLSRHGKPIEKLTPEEQNEAEDLNNLLYMLHTTPVMDHIGLATIAKETMKDVTLLKLSDLIKSGQPDIKVSKFKHMKDLMKFKSIYAELTITGNNIILKGERIVLPETLQELAIELAHKGAHPGQSGLIRRLRSHFFFHGMDERVGKFVSQCQMCNMFTNKKTSEPIKAHKIPIKCWEKVSVDLFGPMPSSKHIVVVQDLKSRFPAAKLVPSTSSDKVLPKLNEIYNAYGNPDKQLSDNGPPFNSRNMREFAKDRDIEIQLNTPYHPSSNPVETFMRPLGKAMKIGQQQGRREDETLQLALNSYRQTPHPSTKIAPGAFLFRDGMKSDLPRISVCDDDVHESTAHDSELKMKNQENINSSKYRKESQFKVGDTVLLRNFKRKIKFDPIFMDIPYQITSVDKNRNMLEVRNKDSILIRHPDDVKPWFDSPPPQATDQARTNVDEWPTQMDDDACSEQIFDDVSNECQDDTETSILRRSTRTKQPNSLYTDFVKY